jgi:cob(I)alamin adenosyltransferase
MKIYTKGGDAGETGLFGGVRVPKDDLRIRTYGTLDELNAALGLVLTEPNLPQVIQGQLRRFQNELFQLGAELATPRGKKINIALVNESHLKVMESEIDQLETELPPLTSFILPGGERSAGLLHLARTISRRAERELVTLNRAEPVRSVVLQYLNRMSDSLFVSARYLNHSAGVADIPWEAPSLSVAAK